MVVKMETLLSNVMLCEWLSNAVISDKWKIIQNRHGNTENDNCVENMVTVQTGNTTQMHTVKE